MIFLLHDTCDTRSVQCDLCVVIRPSNAAQSWKVIVLEASLKPLKHRKQQ